MNHESANQRGSESAGQRGSGATNYGLRITNHASRFTFHVSRFISKIQNLKSKIQNPALLILLALLAAAPLWGPGMVNTRGGGDSPFLLQRTLDMAENLRYSIFPPRWMAHAAYDLGYPMFHHYAALPYYLSGGLTALGISPIVAIQATQTLGFVLAALAMAAWAGRVYRSRPAVILSAAAYTFAPFHLVNVYVRGDSLSEFYAFVWYPLILWSLDRLAERPTRRRILVAALAYGALILTHNISALIFAPFALLYAVVRVSGSAGERVSEAGIMNHESANHELRITHHEFHVSRFTFHVSRFISKIQNPKSKIQISHLLLPFLLAFLLTAWFWAPAILETKYGQMGAEFTEGYFHYSHHFRGWNLVQPALDFNYSVAVRTEDAGPFAMGLVQAGLAAAGVVVLVVRAAGQRESGSANQLTNHESKISRFTFHVSRFTSQLQNLKSKIQNPTPLFILFGLFLSTFMITRFSRPLWDHLPLLEMTQFPWRFLSIQALFTAIVTGAIGECRPRREHEYTNSESASQRVGKSSLHPRLPSTVYRLPISRFTFHVSLLLLIIAAARFSLHPERLLIDDADVTWENLLFYETFTGNIGTTIRYEYLPRDVNPRLYISESVVEGQGRASADGASVEAALLQRTPNRQTWQASLAQAAPVAFPLNWWPGWQAQVDDAIVAAYPMPGSGRLTVDLTAGEHTVTLTLRNTPLRTAANIVSALTIATLLILDFRFWILERRRAAHTADKPQIANHNLQFAICHSLFAIRYLLFAICILVLCLIPPLALHGDAQTDAAFFDFHSAPYPHAGPVKFEAGRLETATQSTATARPGDALTITHTWTLAAGATPLSGTLRLVSPAEPRHGIAVTLAEAPFTLIRSATYPTILRLPDDLSRGLYLIELKLNTPQPSAVYVGAVRVPQGPARRTDAPVLAEFRDLTLHSVAATQPERDKLNVKMAWSTAGTPRNWSLSLRVLDAAGRQIAQQDQETHGYGYLPTTLWMPGEMVTDHAVLPLPAGLAPGDYTLRIITYLRAAGEGGGETDVPVHLTAPTRYDRQEHPGATILCEMNGIALLGVEAPETLKEGQPLDFYAQWNAVSSPTGELTATWRLLAPDAAVIATTSGQLAAGSNVETWPQHTWVRAPVHLDLPATLPTGEYRLQGTLEDGAGLSTTCDLPSALPLTPRPRAFAAPDLTHTQIAVFGDTLQMLGYDLAQKQDTLTLTLWWQASAAPGRDYKRFIHVFDPASETIVAQDDAMPRAWTYPTSLWVAGEVVSETITLDMSAVSKGRYRVAIGWYDPEHPDTRLPAHDASGQPAPLDRIILDGEVTRF